jgi:hypothetical protein
MDPDDKGRILDPRRKVEIESEIEPVHRRKDEIPDLTDLLRLGGRDSLR